MFFFYTNGFPFSKKKKKKNWILCLNLSVYHVSCYWYLQPSYHTFVILFLFTSVLVPLRMAHREPLLGGLLFIIPISGSSALLVQKKKRVFCLVYWGYPNELWLRLVDLSWLGLYCLLCLQICSFFCLLHVQIYSFFSCFIVYFYLSCSTWGTLAGGYQSMLQYCS